MIVTREDLQTLRDLREVALAEYKGCIIEVIRCKPKAATRRRWYARKCRLTATCAVVRLAPIQKGGSRAGSSLHVSQCRQASIPGSI